VQRFGREGPGLVYSLTGVLGTTLGVLSEVALVVVSGIYLASQPGLYRDGLLQLVPVPHLDRAQRILGAAGHALRLWLLGQAIAMAMIGILTGIGVWLLGLPSPLAFGVIAGATEFIPILGPILGAIPAVLIAFSISPMTALYVVLFYIGLQQVESNLLMPLIQERVVALPPVLMLFATVVAGLLFGLLGILFATPLAVACIVATQEIYVRGVLGKDVALLGEGS
jgi:predicted PurR-regulated permease PerM